MENHLKPQYVTGAGGLLLVAGILGVCAAVLVVGVVAILLSGEAIELEAWISLAISLVVVSLIWLIVPQRFEVWPARLSIVFPTFKWDIGFESIEMVRATRWYEPFAFRGVRFGTSPGQSVAVIRRGARFLGRPNIVISPRDRREFLAAMSSAMSSQAQRPADSE
jgi:hypothetical protein